MQQTLEDLLAELISKLYKGCVEFTYRKVDGTLRHAVGTLYGVEHTIKGTGRPKCEGVLCYFDFDCQQWRSFRRVNLVSVEGVRKGTLAERHKICLSLVAKLKKRMQNHEKVAFAYRKANGEIRYAHGVLIDEEPREGYFVYFDTDKNEKRTFCIDRFIGFGEYGSIVEDIDMVVFGATPNAVSSLDDTFVKHDERPSYHNIDVKHILAKHGVDMEDVEEYCIVDLLHELNKEQLCDLIQDATDLLRKM